MNSIITRHHKLLYFFLRTFFYKGNMSFFQFIILFYLNFFHFFTQSLSFSSQFFILNSHPFFFNYQCYVDTCINTWINVSHFCSFIFFVLIHVNTWIYLRFFFFQVLKLMCSLRINLNDWIPFKHYFYPFNFQLSIKFLLFFNPFDLFCFF